MKIAFRLDLSPQIGTGHFQRSLQLARKLNLQGHHIYFFCNLLPTTYWTLLSENNISLVKLEDFCTGFTYLQNNSDLVSEFNDAIATASCLEALSIDWLVVDHYGVGNRWISEIRQNLKHDIKMCIIDDFFEQQFDVEMVIAPIVSIDSHKLAYPMQTCLLLGGEYALVAEEYSSLRSLMHLHRVRTRVKENLPVTILINFGGSDPKGLCSVALEALERSKITPDSGIKLIAGGMNSLFETIERNSKASPLKITALRHVDDMWNYLSEADFVIGSPGSSSWERCCLGVPSVLISQVNNQVAIGRQLGTLGAACYVGHFDDINIVQKLCDGINLLLDDPKRRIRMSKIAEQVCDGLGVQRVVDAIEAFDDASWRN